MESERNVMETLVSSMESPYSRGVLSVCTCLLALGLVELLVIQRWVKTGQHRLFLMDEQTVSTIRKPLYFQVLVWTTSGALRTIWQDMPLIADIASTLYTIAIVVWALTIGGLISRALLRISENDEHLKFIDEQTVGIFLIGVRILLWTLALYLGFLTWSIDLTGWLASAGALGLVLGLAAKDTLANLIAGLALLADKSYQLGDFIRLEDGQNGKVIRIGMRSTTIITRDGVQIAVPNSLLSNGYVVNTSAGPTTTLRLTSTVSVAYGTNLDLAVKTIFDAVTQVNLLAEREKTNVLVKSLGESGVDIDIHAWIENPSVEEAAQDQILRSAYQALNDANIEIPFNQLDITIKR